MGFNTKINLTDAKAYQTIGNTLSQHSYIMGVFGVQ